MNGPPTERQYLLTDAGPFASLLMAFRLSPKEAQGIARAAVTLIAIAWGPLLVVGPFVPGGGSFLSDFSVHARLLVGLPLLIEAERFLHLLYPRALEYLGQATQDGAGANAIDRLLRRAERLRNGLPAELVVLAIAIALGQLNLWTFPHILRRPTLPISPVRVWYSFVSLPLFNFLLLRSLWRWLVWSWLLCRFSRLPMRLIPTHPDLSGGLGLVTLPVRGFAVVLLAIGVSVAGSWATQIVWLGTEPSSLLVPFGLLVACGLLVGLGPLLAFSGKLAHARVEGRAQYGMLARAYTIQFHDRWILGKGTEGLLGSADIQSLADLANSYEVVRRMRLVPFDLRDALLLAGALAVPMTPLVLMQVPLAELLRSLASILV